MKRISECKESQNHQKCQNQNQLIEKYTRKSEIKKKRLDRKVSSYNI